MGRGWAANRLKPHRIKGFKLSNDKPFEAKLADIVGLQLNPPEQALVFSGDEKRLTQSAKQQQPGNELFQNHQGVLLFMPPDIGRDAANKLVSEVKIPTLPTSFLLDKSGQVVSIHRGFKGEETKKKYTEEIESLLK